MDERPYEPPVTPHTNTRRSRRRAKLWRQLLPVGMGLAGFILVLSALSPAIGPQASSGVAGAVVMAAVMIRMLVIAYRMP